MQRLRADPAAAYRRVALDARIEASGAAGLTRICLEEAVAALGQALAALERQPAEVPRAALARAQTIALWLAGSVDPAHPLRASLRQFYGAQAQALARSIAAPDPRLVAQVRADFTDLLAAA